eukprot:CAMPEP_0172187870 /NCGR_PEP_ID=MMETSP1050-20130122/21590_1 /TAXON_ID=233186 /ORGANISM="Cryptomonas curvata, Strain CCAP979/52" /LENGTH=350 /DNA_ID=CAMNT_0012862265 /DNA_START=22 /DNA_END=1070 /DNA_ORIENTATION=+
MQVCCVLMVHVLCSACLVDGFHFSLPSGAISNSALSMNGRSFLDSSRQHAVQAVASLCWQPEHRTGFCRTRAKPNYLTRSDSFRRFPVPAKNRKISRILATNDGMSEGDRPRPALSKILEKTQRLYTSLISFVLSRLRQFSAIKPQYLATLIFATVLLSGLMRGPRTANGQPVPRIAEVPYSTFLTQVKSGGVADAQLSVTSVAYRSNDGLSYFARIPRAPPDLVNVLDANQVPFRQGRPTVGQRVVPYLGLVLYLGVVGFFGWQMLGKGTTGSVGRKAQVAKLDRSLTFDDIAGVDEAKAQVVEVMDIMRNPARYRRLGARQPCGVLLVGPPGTGKTLLARVAAAQSGL